jgi:alkaline phosphatase D
MRPPFTHSIFALVGFITFGCASTFVHPNPILSLPAKNGLRITFGSCNKQFRDQPMWSRILAAQPDLWIWMGDIVYANTRDSNKIRRAYRQQLSQPGYRHLLTACPVIGIWDDHDFGENDADGNYPLKDISQQLLLDFLYEPADTPRRRQRGAYTALDLKRDDMTVRIILLDVRYFRDVPGPDADILGELQWRWLESQVRNSPADFHLIVTPSVLIEDRHDGEKWADFPTARRRFLNLVETTRPKGLILLSGDRHFADVSRLFLSDGAPLYEITSSGLTHCRLEKIRNPFDGAENPYRTQHPYFGLNFGVLDIESRADGWVVTASICDVDGRVRMREILGFTEGRVQTAASMR